MIPKAIAAWKLWAAAGVMWGASIGATYGLAYGQGFARGVEVTSARIINDLQVDLTETRRYHAAAIAEAQRQIDETVEQMRLAIEATNAAALEDARRAEANAIARARRAEAERARLETALASRPDVNGSDWGIDRDWVRDLNAAAAAVAARPDDQPDPPADPERGPDPLPAVPLPDPRAGRGRDA